MKPYSHQSRTMLFLVIVIVLGLSIISCSKSSKPDLKPSAKTNYMADSTLVQSSDHNATTVRNRPELTNTLLLLFVLFLDIIILFYLFYLFNANSSINTELSSIKRLIIDKSKTQIVKNTDFPTREQPTLSEDYKKDRLEFDELLNTHKKLDDKLDKLKTHILSISEKQQNIVNVQAKLEQVIAILNRKEEFDESDYLLDLHFKDVSQSVRRAFLIAEKQDPQFTNSIEQFIKDISSLFMFTELSLNSNKLEMTYQILRKKFEGTGVQLITPLPGDLFDESTMILEKRFSHNDKIHTVLWPGAIIGNHITKALVHVGL